MAPALAAVNQARQLTLWDSATGKPWKSITLPPGGTGSLAWSPGWPHHRHRRRHFGIHLFDASSQAPSQLYRAIREGIARLAWSPDGTRLASAGGDTSVKIWDTRMTASLFSPCWATARRFTAWPGVRTARASSPAPGI